MELLVNSIEQTQPKSYDGTLIKLFGREPERPRERVEVTVRGFEPYFYARADSVNEQEEFLLRQEGVARLGEESESLRGDSVRKIYTVKPQQVSEVREHFDDHYEADVPFTNRFRIDTGIRDIVEVPSKDVHWREITVPERGSGDANPRGSAFENLSPRVITLDIETDDRGAFPEPGEARILSIVAHDSYTGEVTAWIDSNGRSGNAFLEWMGLSTEGDVNISIENIGLGGVVDHLNVEPTERRMLISFASWFSNADPDLVTGWNVDGFDAPHIIERMERVGASPARLSPLGWAGVTSRGDPRIKGRTVYDLLTVYKQNSATELQSYKLDDVAKEELGEEKIQFNESFFELYENDPAKFLEYNTRDVTLVVDINEEADVIPFRDRLRREVGVDFEDSYYNKDFVDMLCRRRLHKWNKVGPSRPSYGEEPDSDFEGGFVFEPFSGVAENVVGLDLASLYPYTMAMLNASPETVDPGGEVTAANNVSFSQGETGLFPSLVEDAISLKTEYKELRKAADTEEKYKKYDEAYLVAKTITNSLYGVTGWTRFFLYDEDVAEAVTLTGQAVIKRTAEHVEERGSEIIYGDTDSVYVSGIAGDKDTILSTAEVMAKELNGDIYPDFATEFGISKEDNLWEIKVEAFMDRFFQYGKKKRYVYLATYKDGREVDDPSPTIVGLSSRRSDTSQLTSRTEKELIEAILHGNEDEVSTIIYEAAQEIKPGDPDWELIGIPQGIRKPLAEYESNDPHIKGAMVANMVLGKDFDKGSKPKRCYIKPTNFGGELEDAETDVICYDDAGDLQEVADALRVDVQRMTATLLANPFREMLAAVDEDVAAAVKGQTQTGLGAF